MTNEKLYTVRLQADDHEPEYYLLTETQLLKDFPNLHSMKTIAEKSQTGQRLLELAILLDGSPDYKLVKIHLTPKNQNLNVN